jgi:hypothetical protein
MSTEVGRNGKRPGVRLQTARPRLSVSTIEILSSPFLLGGKEVPTQNNYKLFELLTIVSIDPVR